MSDYKLSSQYNFIKVLIIDEILYTKRSLSKEFRDIGCFVITANNGDEAIKKITKYKPNIITISRDLPDVTMEKLTEQVFHLVSRKSSKIILVTSKKGDKPKNIPSNIDDYISLPVSNDELKDLVNRNVI